MCHVPSPGVVPVCLRADHPRGGSRGSGALPRSGAPSSRARCAHDPRGALSRSRAPRRIARRPHGSDRRRFEGLLPARRSRSSPPTSAGAALAVTTSPGTSRFPGGRVLADLFDEPEVAALGQTLGRVEVTYRPAGPLLWGEPVGGREPAGSDPLAPGSRRRRCSRAGSAPASGSRAARGGAATAAPSASGVARTVEVVLQAGGTVSVPAGGIACPVARFRNCPSRRDRAGRNHAGRGHFRRHSFRRGPFGSKPVSACAPTSTDSRRTSRPGAPVSCRAGSPAGRRRMPRSSAALSKRVVHQGVLREAVRVARSLLGG